MVSRCTLYMRLSLCLFLGSTAAVAQSLGDDPAFVASRQATEAFNRQDYRQAEQLAQQALQHYPQHLLAHYLHGQIALAENRWEEAVQAFTTVLKLYPGCFVGHRDLGMALEQGKRVEEAMQAYQQALALQPTSEDVQVRLAFLYVQAGRQDAALALLKPLAERGSSMPDVWAVLGRLLYDSSDFAASEKALSRATALRDDGRLWFNLGAVRLRLDDKPGALAAFERAAQHPETREQASRELANVRQAQPLAPAKRSERGEERPVKRSVR